MRTCVGRDPATDSSEQGIGANTGLWTSEQASYISTSSSASSSPALRSAASARAAKRFCVREGDASRAARLMARVAACWGVRVQARCGRVGWLANGRGGVEGPREVRAEEGGRGGVLGEVVGRPAPGLTRPGAGIGAVGVGSEGG